MADVDDIMEGVAKTTISKQKTKELTPATITEMLVAHYHNADNDTAICKNFGVSRPVWKTIKEKHGPKFVEKFGERKRVDAAEVDMDSYWETAEVGKAPTVIASRGLKKPAAAAPDKPAAAPAQKGRPRK